MKCRIIYLHVNNRMKIASACSVLFVIRGVTMIDIDVESNNLEALPLKLVKQKRRVRKSAFCSVAK